MNDYQMDDAVVPQVWDAVDLVQGSDAWQEWRKAGLGATEAAAVIGASKWDTPLTIYAKKIGAPVKQEKTKYQEWGNRLEQPLVNKLLDEHPEITCVKYGRCYAKDWAKCSLDAEGEIYGKPVIIECKTGRNGADWDPVPAGYYAQVQWQMFVTGYRKVFFSVLIAGVDWLERIVEYDEDYVRIMYEACHKFWYDNVLAQQCPEILKETDERDYNALVKIREGAEAKGNIEVDKDTYMKFHIAKENLEKAQVVFDRYKNILTSMMARGYDLCYDGARIAQFVTRSGAETIDKKLLREIAPDVYEKCIKRGGAVSYVKFV